MKQTNNALTFLAASYRAVLDKAYLKGFASSCALLAVASPYAMAASDTEGEWATTPSEATDITVGGSYTDDKSTFPEIFANTFTVDGDEASAVVKGINIQLGQFLINGGGYANFDATSNITITNKLSVEEESQVILNAANNINIAGPMVSYGEVKFTASGDISIGGIETVGNSEFQAKNLKIAGPIELNGISDFNISSGTTINGPLNVAGQATFAARETTITGDVVVDSTALETELGPNYTPGLTFKTGESTGTSTVYVQGGITLNEAELNVLGSDKYQSKVIGKENKPSSPIRTELKATNSDITVDRGSLQVNAATITGSTIKVGGIAPAGGNTNVADVYLNYSNFYMGKGESTGGTVGDALLTDTDVTISDKGVLGSESTIAFSSGSTISFAGEIDTTGPGDTDTSVKNYYSQGKIAAKAILRAKTASVIDGSSVTVQANSNGGLLAQNFTLEGDNSAINVQQDGQLYISGRNTYSHLSEGSLENSKTNTTFEDGRFNFNSGTINNSGNIVIGAYSYTAKSANDPNVGQLNLAKYLFTQNDGTLNNNGTLQIGGPLNDAESKILQYTEPKPYEDAPGTTYIGNSGTITNASGAEINVNQGSSFLLRGTDLQNSGTINVHSGAEFSITGGSKLAGHLPDNISQGTINIASGGNVTIRIDALASYESNETDVSGTYIDTADITSLGNFSNSGTITLDKVNENKAVYNITKEEISKVLGASIDKDNENTSTHVILAADTHLRLDSGDLTSGSIDFSDKSLAQFSGGAGSSIQVDGTIKYTTDAKGETDDFNGLSLVAQKFNFISGLGHESGEISISGSETSKPIFVATKEVTSSPLLTQDKQALKFTNAELHLDASALDLGIKQDTDTSGGEVSGGEVASLADNEASTVASGSVDVNLTFNSGAKLVVDDTLWSAKDITLNAGASFELNGSLDQVLAEAQAKDSTTTLADLEDINQGLVVSGTIALDKESTTKITNGALTANRLLTSGVFEAVGSKITVKGDGSGGSLDFYGGANTKLKNSTIDLGKGSDTIDLKYDSGSKSFIVSDGDPSNGIDYDAFKGEAVDIHLNLSGTGVSGTTVDIAEINGLFGKLVTSGSTGLVHLTGDVNVDFSDAIVSGSNPIEIDFDVIAPGGDLAMDFSTNVTRDAVLVNVSNKVTGGWGAVELAEGQAGPLQVKEKGTLGLYGQTKEGNLVQKADGTVAGVKLNSGSTLMVQSSGSIGDITGDSGSLFAVGNGAHVTVQNTSGSGNGAVNVDKFMSAGYLKANELAATNAELSEGSKYYVTTTNIKENLSANGAYLEGDNINVGTAQFNGSSLKINKDFTAGGDLIFDSGSNVQVDGTLTAATGLKLVGDSFMKVNRIIAQSGDIQVGAESGATLESSSASLEAEHIDLGNGNNLILDPEFGQRTATVFTQNIGQIASVSGSGSEAGSGSGSAVQSSVMNVNGNIVVGRNSALGLGGSASDFYAALAKQQVNGSLTPSETGSFLYVNRGNIQLNDYRLIIGSEDVESLKDRIDGTASIHFGEASTMQITSAALSQVGSGSSVFTGLGSDKSISSTDGKIIVPTAMSAEEMSKLFGSEVQLESGSKIIVTTENGLFTGVVDETADLHGSGDFNQDISEDARNILSKLSNPTFNFAMKVLSNETTHYATEEDYRNGTGGTSGGDTGSSESGDSTDTSGAAIAAANTSQGNGVSVVDNSTGYKFVETSVNSLNSVALEQSARLANLGGIMQVAMQASDATTKAINGTLGGGHDNALNGLLPPGQLGRVWATPIYKNYSSDDFSADGLGYGNDIDMYGAVAGAELSIARGVTTGVTFSIGRGDADGSGIAAGISNEFDYYGFGAYTNLRLLKNLDVLADISYTTVSNEFEANTGVDGFGKMQATTDTDIFSLGVVAQYKYRTRDNMIIMPHAGLRYERIKFDGYNTKVDNEYLNHTTGANANVYSIPIGISMYKDIRSGNWLLRPSADINLTANFGDTDVGTNTTFDGIYGADINYSTEFIDPLVYSANFGITASKQYFSVGASVGYTGSTNSDEFAFGVNARYRF